MTTPAPKAATRAKYEVRDGDGVTHWEILATVFPDLPLRHALATVGYTVHKVSKPKRGLPSLPVYSELDPANSILAAREADARRSTNDTRVLVYMIAHTGEWIDRETIRKVGGDQGDRRARSLRDVNWPIETRQLNPGEAWHVRLNLPDASRYGRAVFGDIGDPSLFDE
jgi:hypothetical protein